MLPAMGLEMVENNIEAYKEALEHIWKDGIASIDEYAMLDVLREKLNVTPEQHLELEILARKHSLPNTKIVKALASQQKSDIQKSQQQKETPIETIKDLNLEKTQKKEENQIDHLISGTLEKSLQKKESIVDSIEHTYQPKPSIKEEKDIRSISSKHMNVQDERQYPCPICRQPLSYISQYKRWYCYQCKKYA